jgi:hypothetical protein
VILTIVRLSCTAASIVWHHRLHLVYCGICSRLVRQGLAYKTCKTCRRACVPSQHARVSHFDSHRPLNSTRTLTQEGHPKELPPKHNTMNNTEAPPKNSPKRNPNNKPRTGARPIIRSEKNAIRDADVIYPTVFVDDVSVKRYPNGVSDFLLSGISYHRTGTVDLQTRPTRTRGKGRGGEDAPREKVAIPSLPSPPFLSPTLTGFPKGPSICSSYNIICLSYNLADVQQAA